MFKTIKDAEAICGTLSAPSKMPCHSYSTPAAHCITGGKLRDVENSVCKGCYAYKRGNYRFPNVQRVLENRYQSLTHPLWVDAITYLIRMKEHSGYMRFHDSGDIYSVQHLENICQVARNLPDIRFWLPTREYGLIREFQEKGGVIPENLIIRLSAYMVDMPAPKAVAEKLGVFTSTVFRSAPTCPAPTQGNMCGPCRKCWDKNETNIAYAKH